MATVNAAFSYNDGHNYRDVTWETLTNANSDGQPVELRNYRSASVQLKGTFGGATVAIQGSNDGGMTYATVPKRHSGSAASATAAEIIELSGDWSHLRPFVTGGSGTDVDVILRSWHDRVPT